MAARSRERRPRLTKTNHTQGGHFHTPFATKRRKARIGLFFFRHSLVRWRDGGTAGASRSDLEPLTLPHRRL
jgi:hypothetical protein